MWSKFCLLNKTGILFILQYASMGIFEEYFQNYKDLYKKFVPSCFLNIQRTCGNLINKNYAILSKQLLICFYFQEQK